MKIKEAQNQPVTAAAGASPESAGCVVVEAEQVKKLPPELRERLRPGATVTAEVVVAAGAAEQEQAEEIAIEGHRVKAALPEGLKSGDRVTLRVAESKGRLVLRVTSVEEKPAVAEEAAAPARAAANSIKAVLDAESAAALRQALQSIEEVFSARSPVTAIPLSKPLVLTLQKEGVLTEAALSDPEELQQLLTNFNAERILAGVAKAKDDLEKLLEKLRLTGGQPVEKPKQTEPAWEDPPGGAERGAAAVSEVERKIHEAAAQIDRILQISGAPRSVDEAPELPPKGTPVQRLLESLRQTGARLIEDLGAFEKRFAAFVRDQIDHLATQETQLRHMLKEGVQLSGLPLLLHTLEKVNTAPGTVSSESEKAFLKFVIDFKLNLSRAAEGSTESPPLREVLEQGLRQLEQVFVRTGTPAASAPAAAAETFKMVEIPPDLPRKYVPVLRSVEVQIRTLLNSPELAEEGDRAGRELSKEFFEPLLRQIKPFIALPVAEKTGAERTFLRLVQELHKAIETLPEKFPPADAKRLLEEFAGRLHFEFDSQVKEMPQIKLPHPALQLKRIEGQILALLEEIEAAPGTSTPPLQIQPSAPPIPVSTWGLQQQAIVDFVTETLNELLGAGGEPVPKTVIELLKTVQRAMSEGKPQLDLKQLYRTALERVWQEAAALPPEHRSEVPLSQLPLPPIAERQQQTLRTLARLLEQALGQPSAGPEVQKPPPHIERIIDGLIAKLPPPLQQPERLVHEMLSELKEKLQQAPPLPPLQRAEVLKAALEGLRQFETLLNAAREPQIEKMRTVFREAMTVMLRELQAAIDLEGQDSGTLERLIRRAGGALHQRPPQAGGHGGRDSTAAPLNRAEQELAKLVQLLTQLELPAQAAGSERQIIEGLIQLGKNLETRGAKIVTSNFVKSP